MQRLETLVCRIGGIRISDEPYPSGIDRPPREQAGSSVAATTWRCQDDRVPLAREDFEDDLGLELRGEKSASAFRHGRTLLGGQY
jgi:hypothetical protein